MSLQIRQWPNGFDGHRQRSGLHFCAPAGGQRALLRIPDSKGGPGASPPGGSPPGGSPPGGSPTPRAIASVARRHRRRRTRDRHHLKSAQRYRRTKLGQLRHRTKLGQRRRRTKLGHVPQLSQPRPSARAHASAYWTKWTSIRLSSAAAIMPQSRQVRHRRR